MRAGRPDLRDYVSREGLAQLTAAAAAEHTGAMIALLPSEADAARLALDDGEPAGELHCTLWFLGEAAPWTENQRSELIAAVRARAATLGGPVRAHLFGVNHWNPHGDDPAWVWAAGDDMDSDEPGLLGARWVAQDALEDTHARPETPRQHSPWVAHVTATYTADTWPLTPMIERLGPVVFDRVRIAFGGDHTDVPLTGSVTAAAGPLRRQPTDLETRARVDFADINDAWHQAVDDTLTAWADIQQAQREQITAAVQAAAEADDLDQLDTLTVDTGPAAELLYARMRAYAERAGRAQQAEAEAQGVTVPEWSLDDEAVTAAAFRDRIRQVARTTARLLGAGLVTSGVRAAMRLFGSGSPAQVAGQVDDHLAGLSDASVREAIGGAMSAAQNEGRMAVLSVAPPGTYVSSEALDASSCQPCRQVDGTRYGSLAEARAAYPTGGYTGCLGGARCRGFVVAVWNEDEDDEQAAAGTIMALAAATIPPTDHEQGGTVYRTVQDHPDCGADTPWAVTDDEGELQGCYATQAEADAACAGMADDSDSNDDPAGMPDEGGMDYAGDTAPWEGPLAVEGIVTGDGREFAPGALTWADLPIPLRWNKEDSHGGEPRTIAVNVGRIDEVWRDGERIMGRGVLDLSDEDGRRVHAKIEGKFLRGVSIDADSIADADTEFVWPDDVNAGTGDDEGEPDMFEMLFAQPEKVIFHGGRIRAATLVDIPAFAEAYIALLDEAGAVVAGGQPVTEQELQALVVQELGAVAVHETATSDGSWDGPANEKRLSGPLTVEQARAAYAWYDGSAEADGELPKSACKFLHHEINADGTVGAANLTACSATIAALHGARGGTSIPAADRRGVYDHVAAHLRDAGREPEPFRALHAVTAGAEVWRPPAEWFTDPKLSLPTPITVTDDGRIYGHAAQWGSCHIGQDDVCVQPPHEDAHPYYRTGEVVCADGSRVAVGQITVGTGHAPLHMGAVPAAEHYDNTGAAVADVAVGNDANGIWVAGCVRPGADPLKVYELQAAGQVSGDWRRIGGQLRLVGLLAVNVPGFPVPKMRARVASGEPQALLAAGRPTVAWGRSQTEMEREAVRIVMRMLSRRVHPGGR